MNILESELAVIKTVAQLCKYTEDHPIAYFKGVDCMIYELYLNKAI